MPKAVRKVIPAPRPHWVGNGFHVFPVFGELAFTQELSPWLMFDYAAPKHFDPSTQRRGVGQHPHRGFETITIARRGYIDHSDSMGARARFGAREHRDGPLPGLNPASSAPRRLGRGARAWKVRSV